MPLSDNEIQQVTSAVLDDEFSLRDVEAVVEQVRLELSETLNALTHGDRDYLDGLLRLRRNLAFNDPALLTLPGNTGFADALGEALTFAADLFDRPHHDASALIDQARVRVLNVARNAQLDQLPIRQQATGAVELLQGAFLDLRTGGRLPGLDLTKNEATLLDALGRSAALLELLLALDPDWAPSIQKVGGLDPTAEEHVAFERLWSTIEKAVDLDLLDDATDDEFRTINRLRHTAQQLPEDRYQDLHDLLAKKVAALLPALVSAIAPDVTSPITPALNAAIDQADHSSQLEALAESLEQTADVLETGAQDATAADGSVKPYFPAALVRAESVAGRLEQTFRRIDRAYAALTSTKVGRRIANLSFTGVTIGTTAGVAAVASGAGVPYAGDPRTMTAAIVSSVIGRWLYARRRRQDPSLPPALAPIETSVTDDEEQN